LDFLAKYIGGTYTRNIPRSGRGLSFVFIGLFKITGAILIGEIDAVPE
jgi:hypothetical protein